MALDIAMDTFENNNANDNADVAKKVALKKQKALRKNNMRAMIAKARKEAAKQGGGGQIEVAGTGNKNESESESEEAPPKQQQKKSTSKQKKEKKQKVIE